MNRHERILSEATDILCKLKEKYGDNEDFYIRLIMTLTLFRVARRDKFDDIELIQEYGKAIAKAIAKIEKVDL